MTRQISQDLFGSTIAILARDELWSVKEATEVIERFRDSLDFELTGDLMVDYRLRVMAYQRKYLMLKNSGHIGVGLIFDLPTIEESAEIAAFWADNREALTEAGIIAPVQA